MAKRTTEQTAIWAGVVLVMALGIYYWMRKPEELDLPPGDPTITPLYADETADALYEAMNMYGTEDEELDSIYNTLVGISEPPLNDVDKTMIWNAFGSRCYDKITGSSGSFPTLCIGGYQLNLGQWLSEELNWESEETRLNNWRTFFINVAPF